MVATTLEELISADLVTEDKSGSYQATTLSQATVASFLTREDGLFLHENLHRALQAFVIDGEMHIFYTFTPIYNNGVADINWRIFRWEMEKLDDSGLRVLTFVSVYPGLVNRL